MVKREKLESMIMTDHAQTMGEKVKQGHRFDSWIALQLILSHCLLITDITTGTCAVEQKHKNASLFEGSNLANQQLTIIC